MLHNILSLFGKTPSEPLLAHLSLVSECVMKIPPLIIAVEMHDKEKLNKLKNDIYAQEERAEKLKAILRSNLLGSVYLSIDRSIIIEILSLQDKLANTAKDIAFLLTVRPLVLSQSIVPQLHKVVATNIEAFTLAKTLLQELPLLLESSFSGVEAERAIMLIEQIADKERAADLLQIELLRTLLEMDTTLTPGQFHIYNKIFECISSISDLSERLALAVRATIASI